MVWDRVFCAVLVSAQIGRDFAKLRWAEHFWRLYVQLVVFSNGAVLRVPGVVGINSAEIVWLAGSVGGRCTVSCGGIGRRAVGGHGSRFGS